MLRDINRSVVFLIETKLQVSSMKRVRCQCGYRNGIDVDSDEKSEGLSIGWNSYC